MALMSNFLLSVLAAGPLEHVLPHVVFEIGPLKVTNQMVMALVAAVLMLLIFPPLFRRTYDGAPSGARNLFESILEFLRVEVFRPALKENTDRFVPFLWTLFFFILFCNLLGSIPIADILRLILGRPVHWGGTATGNINTTAALAVCAFFAIHVSGVLQIAKSLRDGTYGHHGHHEEHSSDGGPGHEAAIDLEHGRGDALPADVPQQIDALSRPGNHYHDDEHVKHPVAMRHNGTVSEHGRGMGAAGAALLAVPLYFWNFAPHPFKPEPGQSKALWGLDVVMWLLLLVLELIGAVIKPVALSIRLFANMIAGHLVLAVLVSLIPVTASLAVQMAVGVPVTALSLMIRLLELFVAFLQAYIFTFLTTLFIASAVAPEH